MLLILVTASNKVINLHILMFIIKEQERQIQLKKPMIYLKQA